MSPVVMTVILVACLSALAYSLNRRWQLLKVGRPEERLDRIPDRVSATLKYAFGQYKMPWYPLAGVAHALIFAGFLVLLLRSLILWGRGFSPSFNLFLLGPDPVALPLLGQVALGHFYDLVKDIFAMLVLIGTGAFFYLRLVVKDKRMTLHWEGLLILGIIATMMLADLVYDGSLIALGYAYPSMLCAPGASGLCAQVQTIVAPLGADPPAPGWLWFAPVGSIVAGWLKGLSPQTLTVTAHAGFWIHSSLVLIFANILPYTKHFHIFTVIPNVFTTDLTAPGRLRPMAQGAEKLMEAVGAAMETEDLGAAAIGVARVEHFTWKAMLDFYTCTECGRCSDNCPAHRTGKVLSPKQLTIDLRNHLYDRAPDFINAKGSPLNPVAAPHAHADHTDKGDDHADHDRDSHDHDEHGHDAHGHHEPQYPENPVPNPAPEYQPIDLVSGVVNPDVLWACTTCRACEEFCPVLISYVDKIVDMRRNLVLIRGEMPNELQKTFQAMETNGNPWNLSRMDRAAWAEGLDVPLMADKPSAEVLLWVGCAASYDDRAKKVARATARLLKAAGVDFAILGQEENCTGDSARRAGNEFLFATLAETNVATLNSYRDMGGIKKIVAVCPHCFNTLKNEYPDFGGSYEVIHHAELLLSLVREGKLTPQKSIKQRIVFHDSCYLGRYNQIYDQPRDVIKAIPGVELAEVDAAHCNKGLCCGAGGAQMWMEEQNKDRMNVRRTLQLLDTNPKTIASACPFCMTMITDGLKSESKEDQVRQLDIAELLAESCLDDPKALPQSAKIEETTEQVEEAKV